jgi:hypothetical protein
MAPILLRSLTVLPRLALLAALALAPACGGGGSGGDDDSAGDDDGGGDDDDGGGDDDPGVDAGDDAPGLDPEACAGFAANAVAAYDTCGGPAPGGAAEALTAACEKGIEDAAMCGGDPAAGLECFREIDAGDWTCPGGATLLPYCDNDLGAALGMYCLVALGTTDCASGIACEFDADCGGGDNACNEVTQQCYAKDAYCVGLPCEFDADCPNGHVCNDAEGACVLQAAG